MRKIHSALISVFYKDGLDVLVKTLDNHGVIIYSTGGTQSYIESLGIDVIPVEDLTEYPSILGGRVKTLHPKIFGGILGRRDHPTDIEQMSGYEIPEIDLVIVDLYPFEETIAKTDDESEIIEKIDIGGISLIRAAAKNFNDVVIISSKHQYVAFNELLDSQQGQTSLEQRKKLAVEAFAVSSHYDAAIFNYFNKDFLFPYLKISEHKGQVLRYGENPHQNGVFYGALEDVFDKLNGKELSYNNLVDIDAGVHLIAEFNEPTFVVLKHTNPCGVASRDNLLDAWNDALAGDPVSAFGGVLVTNSMVDEKTAEAMNSLFFEVLVAPDFTKEAVALLSTKKNRILLKQKLFNFSKTQFKTLLNGVIVQDTDYTTETETNFTLVTSRKPSDRETADLVFANKIAKHLKSNTIVFAKNKQLLGMGCGQTSRVDATRQAIEKANSFGFDLEGSVMASDAFFPFPDCVEIAYNAGIKSVVQPGGSIKDQESINFCEKNNISMVLTGTRHFKH
ncbi:MAG: bifunctional phosphoribosylaminoimidazolecarboxamide formyltransferase/IMP cyclohydrolase [Chitinophagales bacterium]|nr:bifunctional phosphoribosylaminoimidazolecarboxamide formyltransferase/IMP cyclohydrolase [Chitinophagales bacterium]